MQSPYLFLKNSKVEKEYSHINVVLISNKDLKSDLDISEYSDPIFIQKEIRIFLVLS